MGPEKKQTIMIVDDSEMNRAILTEMLAEEYGILEAEDGLEAIEILSLNYSRHNRESGCKPHSYCI